MSDIEDAFDKLNGYIGEISGKKKKTITMLSRLRILMDADRGKVSCRLSEFDLAYKSIKRLPDIGVTPVVIHGW
jgi:hypothetical protein